MLDRQVASGDGVEGEGDVTGGEDTRSAGAHAVVDLDPPGLDGQAGRDGDVSLGLHAPGHEDQVALGTGLASEADPAVLDRLHLRTQPERYAVFLEPSRRSWLAASPSRAACGPSSMLTSVTARPRRASDAAASQPMKPDPTTTAEPAAAAAARSSLACCRERR